jgi:hypothetical protein
MCVDLPGVASQETVPGRQRDHVARRRYVSGFVIVSVALAHPNNTLCLLSWCALTRVAAWQIPGIRRQSQSDLFTSNVRGIVLFTWDYNFRLQL